jgi:riboflavin synthase
VFTGLVQATGKLASCADSRVRIETRLARDLSEGDSVAVNGVCLTVTAAAEAEFQADVMPETLRCSALGALSPGDRVNLELPLRADDRLGGHFVQGHVDGVGTVESLSAEDLARVVRISAPAELLRYVVAKGSIAVDGVSLTVVDVDEGGFRVSLVPETLARTTLGDASPGRPVNLEVDLLAKYVEKLGQSAVTA